MADTRYVRFRYGPTVHTVAMYPGLPSEEFTMILKALLPVQVQGNIIGLQGEQGEVVPITLSCRSPEVLRDSTYVLLVSGDTSTPSSQSQQRSDVVLPSAPPLTSAQQDDEDEEYQTNIAPPAPPLKPSTNPVYDDELTADDAQEEDNTMDELLRFIAGLRVKRIISKTESDALEELLFSNSSLVLAAYSVAKSAGDSQYLANICKDIAQSMMTTAGQSACAAQEEVLQCCDHLYLSRKITDNQLLYLRHLVLIREEEVAEVYDEFQIHRDLDRMFRELHRIANTHPKNPDDEEDDEEGEEDDEETEMAEMAASPAFATTLGGVLSLMHRAQLVTAAEAMLLNHMIVTENEFLLAAHELFVHDGDINELQDTMIRCAKLVSRRMNERQEYKEEDESEEDEEESEGNEDPEDHSHSQLDEILDAVGVQNSWSATVPSRFILAVFAAAQKDLLAVGQARALCDLYQAKYDLVRAAWEVYNVQGDVVDFTDTLRRIVRDLNFRDDGNVQVTSSDQQSRDVFTAVKESKDRTEAAFNNKQEAVLAVAEAKQELLRHSLEMMVKQEIIAGDAAQSLYERAARGDPLTDAAIEAYASDRNIMEFLDTLQILANNTPEEINRIMRSAIDEDGDEESDEQEPLGSDNESSSDEKTDEYDDSDFEDDDEENGSGQELDMAQKKLYEIVLELVEEDMINSGTATILMTLINNRDDRVMAAFDVYSEYQDKDDLVDSLLRVARKELQEYLTARAAQDEDEGIEMSSLKKEREAAETARFVEVEMTQMKNERDEDGEDNDDVESDGGNDGAQVGLLNSGDQASILDILSKAGAIEAHHAERIIQLINANDVDVRQIFLEYERKKDVYHLIENLRSFIGDSDSEDAGDDDDDDEDQGEDVDEDSESIEARFLNIIQEMNLSHLETAALRLAIARDDFAIRSALEMFRVSRDEAELIETLRNVAKKTIDTTLTEAGYDGIQEDDVEDTEEADDDEEEEEEDEDEEQEYMEEEGNDSADDENDEDDSDGEEEDDDEEGDDRAEADENEEGGLMSTQSAREYIFPILLSELVKENVLGENDGEVLKQLFSNGDAVVNAALDVYDLDSDMAELVDTLQKVARSQ
mmetsp:Transcript_13985/g.23160  ORF Transcript_13985/g.23160 Transcript_13985/m.23160 type:complete len:1107 (-) Transcript_13985:207-3527(-)|eukprot:CAMPEP_0114427240 /NCGR_PEP_ID=MMETSP0103-20121206/8233_1 /TAXON_ID=37642 ORGANISM="Paraphysomonas imperforata, Strain PA2" /NCGR_SAMPLE_ID=MMETSP0103 /ASSEMBLY_ACC=CAM_ASM_000201 /LENGTH=1106 /DNA_ID=CAMNT_0001596269 /DNA_START=32 /DNA_END=3352 /DNA_ORIENTATION=-